MQVLAVPVTRNLLIHYFTLYGKVSQLVYCSPLEDHKGLGDTEPLSRLAAKWGLGQLQSKGQSPTASSLFGAAELVWSRE